MIFLGRWNIIALGELIREKKLELNCQNYVFTWVGKKSEA